MTTTGSALPAAASSAPLAVRMRPRSLDEIVGQSHILTPGGPLWRLAHGERGSGATSVILWGPPGTGKTTIAGAIAHTAQRRFVELSAVTAGVKDVRTVMEDAMTNRDLYGAETVLFLDEIHRFTKAQQDALLPGVERGWVTLVAATTENPSFSVISPLLSRSLLLTLRALTDDDVATVLDRAVSDPRGLADAVVLSPEARDAIVRLSSGDARRALTALEAAAAAAEAHVEPPAESREDGEAAYDAQADVLLVEDAAPDGTAADGTAPDGAAPNDPAGDDGTADTAATSDAAETAVAAADDVPEVTAALVAATVDRALLRYDRQGDEHYDVISAFIKSVRGSDVDASLHYLARMIEAGEDPRFIARRLIVLAAEDIGMAEPQGLPMAVAAADAVQFIGMPEGRIPLAEATVFLATAPKSNRAYRAIDAAIAEVRAGGVGRVPIHLRDGHYPGAKRLGHGKGYRYAHDAPAGIATQQYLPDELVGREYYTPTEFGHEREIAARLARVRAVLRGESPPKAPRPSEPAAPAAPGSTASAVPDSDPTPAS